MILFQSENPTFSRDPPDVRCSKFTSDNENCIVVIINESVISFNSAGSELLTKSSFEFLIDCYSVVNSPSGPFLLVALNNGDLHCVFLNTEGQSFFLKSVHFIHLFNSYFQSFNVVFCLGMSVTIKTNTNVPSLILPAVHKTTTVSSY